MKSYLVVTLCGIIALTSGCGTIISGSTDDIAFKSNPKGAKVELNGSVIGYTPLTASVQRNLSPARAKLTLDGYEPYYITLQKQFNEETLFNILFFPGFIVDAATGSLRKYSITEYKIELVPLDKSMEGNIPAQNKADISDDKIIEAANRKAKELGVNLVPICEDEYGDQVIPAGTLIRFVNGKISLNENDMLVNVTHKVITAIDVPLERGEYAVIKNGRAQKGEVNLMKLVGTSDKIIENTQTEIRQSDNSINTKQQNVNILIPDESANRNQEQDFKDLSDILPGYQEELVGLNEVRIKNPNEFNVIAGIRSSTKGKNLVIQKSSTASVYIPNGKYEIYFVYSDKPDALFQGDDFSLNNNGIEIQIVQIINGNYNIRQVK